MMKKIIAGISALALSLTALSSMVYAADYEVSLGSGTTSTALEDDIAYISVYGEGLSNAICATGTIAISVPSGTLNTEDGWIMVSENLGMSKKVGMKTNYPTYECAVNADASSGDVQYGKAGDGLDTVVVSWAGTSAYTANKDDLLFEIAVNPISNDDIDMKLIYVGVDIYEDETLQAYKTSTVGVNTEYVLKAGTSTITEKSSATPTPTATATPTPTPVVTPEPTATVEPTATPVPTFDSGVSVFNEENDAAAWAWKTAPTEGSKVAVTLKVNGEEQVPKTFALKAAVEGTTKVGVIVQYNPTQFQTVEIVNIDFE